MMEQKKYRLLINTAVSYDVVVDAESIAEAEELGLAEVRKRIQERITDAVPDRVVMDIDSTVTGIFLE